MVNRRDVAKKAGVSPATVSRVLGNYGSVSPEIAARVLKVATELGYRPNLAARSLKTNRTGRIGVIVHDITNPYYAEIVGGIEERAKMEGYTVSVCAASNVGDLDLVNGFLDQQFDGLVVASSWYAFAHTRLPALAANGLPVVLGPEASPPPGDEHESHYHRVVYDWRGTVEAAVSYLIGLGHRRIAFLSSMNVNEENGKYLGYTAALAKHGLPYDERLVVSLLNPETNTSIQVGQKEMETLLARNVQPTAIMAFNDLVAMGAIATIIDAGLRVPEDISVMGQDDVALAAVMRPGLSTIRVPKIEQGRLLVWIIARLLQGEEIKKVWNLDGGLVIRQTTQRLQTQA
ncbi:MAG: LacI family DNA-binding transcriptional regulator [Patescibacteria group bacterium]